MAVMRENNWLGQQRLDVPQLRSIESGVRGDFDLLAGTILSGKNPLIIRGFTLTATTVGLPASSIQVIVANSVLTNINATESGSMFSVGADVANETLSSLNAKVSGSFTASATNYVGVDIRRSADATTSDIVQFLNATTLLETSRTVPLARTLTYKFVVSTTDFSSQPNLCPIAIVVTNASNQISSITDARQLAYRLGSGGSFADQFDFYSFPGGRSESQSALDMSSGDKVITNQYDWGRAAMTRMWELGGGEFWYSATADRNVTMIWGAAALFSNGEDFEWDGTDLHWKEIRFLFDNSTGYYNIVSDQITDVVGLTDLADGECVYVDLDRTSNATVVAAKGVLATLGPGALPGARHIMAYRHGANIYTKNWRYPIGTVFQPATTTSMGMVKLSRAATTPVAPIVIADTGGVITTQALTIGLQINSVNTRPGLYVAPGGLGSLVGVPPTAIFGDNNGDDVVGLVGRGQNYPGILGFTGTDATAKPTVTEAECGVVGWDRDGSFAGVLGISAANAWADANFSGFGWLPGVAGFGCDGVTGGTGVWGRGGNLAGVGVRGDGDGVGVGGMFTGGATNAAGVQGQGGGTTGMGGLFYGGSGTAFGLTGHGGATGGAGVRGVGTAGSGPGVSGQGNAAGAGVEGAGGLTGPGGSFTAGATSGPAIQATIGPSGIAMAAGSGLITTVLDPVSLQDAATKNYVDQSRFQNHCINGRFDFWQRGASFALTATVAAAAGLFTTKRAYCADRWYVFNQATDATGAPVITATQRIAADGTPTTAGFERACRFQRTSGGTQQGRAGIVQEIDRDFVQLLRGRKVSITFMMRIGADSTFPLMQIRSSNNASAAQILYNPAVTTQEGYSTVTNVVGATVNTASGTYQTFTYTSSAVLPTDTTNLAVAFYAEPNVTAGAAAWIEVTGVRISVAPSCFTFAGGTVAGELVACKRYFEQSSNCELPGPGVGYDGSEDSYTAPILVATGNPFIFGSHPRFTVEKRLIPTVTLYDTAGNTNAWFISGVGPTTANAIRISTNGFIVANNTGGNVTPTSGTSLGAWRAECEI